MNVAVLGSVSSSWYCLDGLIAGGVEITGVLGVDNSQAARISDYRPLRERAEAAGLPFHSFVKVSEPGVEAFLCAHRPDLLWVIGISQLVPDRLIQIARVGGIGFHPTMLPEGRGRAPVAWTILRGAQAAVSLFYLAAEADAGDLIAQRPVPVLPDDYSEDLILRTNEVLRDVILDLAPRITAGTLSRRPQDHAQATRYPKRTPADGVIDWAASTEQVYRLIRAAGRPYPGAFTFAQGRKVTIWRGQPAAPWERPAGSQPATIVDVAPRGLLISTGDGAIWATEVVVDGGVWAVKAGDRLG